MPKGEEKLKMISIELFCQLNNLLDESGQKLLFEYDRIINKLYQASKISGT